MSKEFVELLGMIKEKELCIEKLEAENKRLTMFNTAYADTITKLNGVVKFEKEQNEALRKDAERYRWLRNVADNADWEYLSYQTQEVTDSEIDCWMRNRPHD